MVLQIGSRLRDMKRGERDISFLLVQILARDHGCRASRIKRRLITPSSLIFLNPMCRRSLLLWGFGYSITDRLVSSVFGNDLQPFPIWVVVSPHTSLPGLDWRCLWYESIISNDTWESISYSLYYCWQRAKLCTRSALVHVTVIHAHFDFPPSRSVVAIRFIGACLLTSSRRLLLFYLYWRHLLVLLLSPQPPSRWCYCGGSVHGNIHHDGAIGGG